MLPRSAGDRAGRGEGIDVAAANEVALAVALGGEPAGGDVLVDVRQREPEAFRDFIDREPGSAGRHGGPSVPQGQKPETRRWKAGSSGTAANMTTENPELPPEDDGFIERLREAPAGTKDPNIVGEVGPTDVPPGEDPPR